MPKSKITKILTLSPELHDAVQEVCEWENTTFTSLVRALLVEKIKSHRTDLMRLKLLDKAPKGDVGRPRQTVEEKSFKDTRDGLATIFQNLKGLSYDIGPGAFETQYGDLLRDFEALVEAHSLDGLKAMRRIMPWATETARKEWAAVRDGILKVDVAQQRDC